MSEFFTLKVGNDNGETGYVIAKYDSPTDTPPTYQCLGVNKKRIWLNDLQKAIVYKTKGRADDFRDAAERNHLYEKTHRWRLVSEPVEAT